MEKYKILYIDEQEEYRENFKDLANENLEIETAHPKKTKGQMMQFIRDNDYDAVIVDYGLMNNDPAIKYTGDEIIKKINEEKEDFPALVITQNIDQDGGVDEKVSATKILLKEDVDHDKPGPFQRKIRGVIEYYKNENLRLSRRMNTLEKKRKKQHGRLSDKDLDELRYLDEKIERRMNGTKKFPEILKGSKNLKAVHDTISHAEKILKKMVKD
jgi:DNA-binding NarL/FixJ family response regulator